MAPFPRNLCALYVTRVLNEKRFRPLETPLGLKSPANCLRLGPNREALQETFRTNIFKRFFEDKERGPDLGAP